MKRPQAPHQSRRTHPVALEARAAERRLSIREPVAEMAALTTSREALSTDDVAELDCRWAAIEAGEATISNDAVIRWLRTWGSLEDRGPND